MRSYFFYFVSFGHIRLGGNVSGTSHCWLPLSLQALGLPDITVLLLLFFCQSLDILSTIGYDSIIQHLNNGRKNCKEFEDFLKERYMLFPLRRQKGGQNAPTQTRNNYYLVLMVHKTLVCRLWNNSQEVNDVSVLKFLETNWKEKI